MEVGHVRKGITISAHPGAKYCFKHLIVDCMEPLLIDGSDEVFCG